MTDKIARPSDPEILLAQRFVLKYPLRETQPKPVVLLLHPPKTGGTTLHFNLEAAQSYKGIPYMRFRIDRDAYTPPTLMVRGWTGAWTSPDVSADALAHLGTIPSDQTIFVSGHFPYGFHERLKPFFPDRPFNYIGQIRDPVSRERSSVKYEAAKSEKGLSVVEYMDALPQLMDNPQTRLYAGFNAMNADICNDIIYERACANITASFNMIATTEQTHSLMSAIIGKYDLPPIAYHKSNITPDDLKAGLPDNFSEMIDAKHHYDRHLHSFARAHWVRWFSSHVTGTVGTKDTNLPVVYVPQDYDATRTARLTTWGERGQGTGIPLTQKKPDRRFSHP